MKIVILGAGRRGLRLARNLIEENKEVTFLDNDAGRCSSAIAKLDCMAICGSATDIEKLRAAGCESADAVIAVTSSDEINLVSCGIVSSQFPSVKQTIATIRGISYISSDNASNFRILGISHIVNPDMEAATRINGIIQSGLFRDVIFFPDCHYVLFTKTIGEGDSFSGKNLIQIKQEHPGQYVLTGIKRRNKVFTPYGTTVLQENDEVAIIADENEAGRLNFTDIVTTGGKLRKIVIIGATRITKYLLSGMSASLKRHVMLIEKDGETCRSFAEEFPDVLVLNASITDESLWDDEKLHESDLVISITDNDELNIIVASYAKRQGCKRTMALIRTNTNYMQLARHMDIDAPISTTDATVDTIMKYIRADGIKTLHSLFDGELEVYEYRIGKDFRYIGEMLKDVKMGNKAIIASVSRGREKFIPDGSYAFEEDDIILVSASHRDYAFIADLFS